MFLRKTILSPQECSGLVGRALDWGLQGFLFCRDCKTLYPPHSTGSTQEDPSRHEYRLFTGMLRIKPNNQMSLKNC